MKYFALGFVTAAVVLAVGVWFAWRDREQIVKWISVGYEPVDRPAVLLTDVELRQKGEAVGTLNKGTVVVMSGRAKDSPIEYLSVPLGWENRGVDAQKIYRILPKDESTFVEMVVRQKP
jgi:hypothetical protein